MLDDRGQFAIQRGRRRGQPVVATAPQQAGTLEQLFDMGRHVDDAAARIQRQPTEIEPPKGFGRQGGSQFLTLQRDESPQRDAQMRRQRGEQRADRWADRPTPRTAEPGIDAARLGHADGTHVAHPLRHHQVGQEGLMDGIIRLDQFGQRIDPPFAHMAIGKGIAPIFFHEQIVDMRGRWRPGMQFDDRILVNGAKDQGGVDRARSLAQPLQEILPQGLLEHPLMQSRQQATIVQSHGPLLYPPIWEVHRFVRPAIG